MHGVRRFLMRRHRLAAWLVAAALAMKLLVPAGFMPVIGAHSITIQLCSGTGPAMMAMPGMAHHGSGKADHTAKEMPCGFGGLAAPSIGGADAILLAAAFVFIMAAVRRPHSDARQPSPRHLRPPAQAPPVLI